MRSWLLACVCAVGAAGHNSMNTGSIDDVNRTLRAWIERKITGAK